MGIGEIVDAVMMALFAIAFALWAKRLDKALDVLERLQEEMHRRSLIIERRLTRLEAVRGVAGIDDDG